MNKKVRLGTYRFDIRAEIFFDNPGEYETLIPWL